MRAYIQVDIRVSCIWVSARIGYIQVILTEKKIAKTRYL